jgi:hypothetical protein
MADLENGRESTTEKTSILGQKFRVPEVAGNLTRDRYLTRHGSDAPAG